MSNNKCPNCSSVRYRLVSLFLIDDNYLLKCVECRDCKNEWSIQQSLLSSENQHKYLWLPNEKRAVPLHRWVWEQSNGRSLLPIEVIHHINRNKGDNRVPNLALMNVYSHNGRFNNSLNCKRCRHSWTPRQQEITICPKCKSPYWNKARRRENA